MDVQKSSSADVKIGVRKATREKYEQIQRDTRLKLVDIADLAIDALIADRARRQGRRKTAAA